MMMKIKPGEQCVCMSECVCKRRPLEQWHSQMHASFSVAYDSSALYLFGASSYRGSSMTGVHLLNLPALGSCICSVSFSNCKIVKMQMFIFTNISAMERRD